MADRTGRAGAAAGWWRARGWAPLLGIATGLLGMGAADPSASPEVLDEPAVAATPAPEAPAPLGARIDTVLAERRVGDLRLGEYLAGLDTDGCLGEVAVPLVDGLADLADAHRTEVGRRAEVEVWRIWEPRLRRMSEDGRRLVTHWITSPEVARRRFLCEDGLPPTWISLAPDRFVIEAVLWFEGAVAAREESLRKGITAERDRVVVELMQVQDDLVNRFQATYRDDAVAALAQARMEDRLDLMWEALIEPWHTGFHVKARPEEQSPLRGPKAPPLAIGPLGGDIPDPDDVAASLRILASWRRERRVYEEQLADRRAHVDQIASAARAEEDPEVLARLAMRARRVEHQLAATIEQIGWFQDRVRADAGGGHRNRVVERLLSGGGRKRTVKKLDQRVAELQRERGRAEAVVADAVARGAVLPGSGGAGGGAEGGAGGPLAAAGEGSGGPGPGNWTAGLPGTVAVADSAGTEGGESGAPPLAGAGVVKRIYEGPLSSPSSAWSPDLVQALRTRHPELDDTDARILLGLILAAYRELVDVPGTEKVVWENLGTAEGLGLRGQEATLSDLWKPGRPASEQPEVTFVLQLRF
ncbi:hypothetical protein L6R50_24090 [Myxococcota bacterium]|nr:hypothetical protein [Myxococcota bacterium]